MTAAFLATGFCASALLLHLASVAAAAWRCRPLKASLVPPAQTSPVTLLRPLCGMENYCVETLRSSFHLDYPRYEVIFCLASEDDAILPLVRRLIAAHPHIDARLLVGNERICSNPKLNNLLKGWREAKYQWIALADSNVLMPRDYIQRLLASWTPDTGLVCAPPVGCRPQGLWAELECAFLNPYQARWQYFADTIGLGFAQGKSMLWRRAQLERAGGIGALANEVAEDAAATKIVRAAGLRVRLADAPFGQPLGRRRLAEVWNRQVRWARLRRASFTFMYVPEIFSGSLPTLLAAAFAAAAFDLPVAAVVAAVATLWYGAEALLAQAAQWPLSWRAPLVAMLRDLMLPVLWLEAWRGHRFVWRGNLMHAQENGIAAAAPGE